jgi:2-dehydropantoate 2-reductase
MKILVVGAGAVGGYFGARLSQAGRDVTFLVRPSRAQQLQRDGLRIVSPYGDLTIKPQTVISDEIHTPYEIIFLSVKSVALNQAIADMVPAVGPSTMIYPVLNGMRHIDILASRFDPHAVLGGVCMVSTELDSEGRIVQFNEMQTLTYGERDGQITPRIRQLDETFRDAGFETELSPNIIQAMWQKWVGISTLGLVNCLFNAPVGEINAVLYGEETALQALDECAAVAIASGYPASKPFLDNVRQRLTAKGSKLTASMYRDMQKGANLEFDAILGDLLEHARTHQLKTPLLQAACVRLRVYLNTISNSPEFNRTPPRLDHLQNPHAS